MEKYKLKTKKIKKRNGGKINGKQKYIQNKGWIQIVNNNGKFGLLIFNKSNKR